MDPLLEKHLDDLPDEDEYDDVVYFGEVDGKHVILAACDISNLMLQLVTRHDLETRGDRRAQHLGLVLTAVHRGKEFGARTWKTR